MFLATVGAHGSYCIGLLLQELLHVLVDQLRAFLLHPVTAVRDVTAARWGRTTALAFLPMSSVSLLNNKYYRQTHWMVMLVHTAVCLSARALSR